MMIGLNNILCVAFCFASCFASCSFALQLAIPSKTLGAVVTTLGSVSDCTNNCPTVPTVPVGTDDSRISKKQLQDTKSALKAQVASKTPADYAPTPRRGGHRRAHGPGKVPGHRGGPQRFQ